MIDGEGKLTHAGLLWIYELVNTYRENCVAISVLRREDPVQCDQGLGGVAK